MRFPYASYEVDPSPTVPGGVVYRPELIVDVAGPLRSERIQALVDTGSDETVFPLSLAESIGVNLDRNSAGQASAVGGHAIELIPGRVTMQLAQNGQVYRWHVAVGFLQFDQPEDEVALLGYAGFLEFFHAAFDSERRALDIRTNRRFPQTASMV